MIDSYDKVILENYCVRSYKELWKLREQFRLHRIHPEDFEEVVSIFCIAHLQEEYCDNFRVFPYSQKKAFEAQRAKGCCGSANWSHVCKSGRKYLLGFNYGH